MLSLEQLAQILTFDLTKDQVRAILRVGLRAVFAVHILFACGWLSIFGLSGFASAGEINGLKAQVAQLTAQVQKSDAQREVRRLEAQLRDVDSEIFTIEAKLAEIGRLGQQADVLYSQRLSSLRVQRGQLERDLATANRNPALDLKVPAS